MGYLAALSLSRGVRAGFAAVGGIALGLSIYGVAAVFGLSALIEESPALYQTLRWGGVAYLLYLAWEAWTADPRQTSDASREAHDMPRIAVSPRTDHQPPQSKGSAVLRRGAARFRPDRPRRRCRRRC